ncbi:MAG: hypothetical protein QOJ21_3211 [Solirubrobacteraceae bacterium]|nr:hypothetical protein [Solirubrobacteraceae bacterium]
MTAASLDLTRPRTLGELISETFALFGRHSGVFLTATLIVVTPVTLLVDGIWGRALAEGAGADPAPEVSGVAAALNALVILPLITAMHAIVVQAVARGEDMDVGDALRAAAARLRPAVGTVLIYSLAAFAGTLLFVVPGIWIAIRWYVGVQAAVVEDLPPMKALARSAELVRGSWWRTFGCVVTMVLVALVLASVMTAVVAAFDSPPIYVTGLILAQAVTLSLTATFGTLLYFDLRARHDVAAGAAASDGPGDAAGEWPAERRPEAPDGWSRPGGD